MNIMLISILPVSINLNSLSTIVNIIYGINSLLKLLAYWSEDVFEKYPETKKNNGRAVI
jgi:hypothetical protein